MARVLRLSAQQGAEGGGEEKGPVVRAEGHRQTNGLLVRAYDRRGRAPRRANGVRTASALLAQHARRRPVDNKSAWPVSGGAAPVFTGVTRHEATVVQGGRKAEAVMLAALPLPAWRKRQVIHELLLAPWAKTRTGGDGGGGGGGGGGGPFPITGAAAAITDAGRAGRKQDGPRSACSRRTAYTHTHAHTRTAHCPRPPSQPRRIHTARSLVWRLTHSLTYLCPLPSLPFLLSCYAHTHNLTHVLASLHPLTQPHTRSLPSKHSHHQQNPYIASFALPCVSLSSPSTTARVYSSLCTLI